jgi:zinc protease
MKRAFPLILSLALALTLRASAADSLAVAEDSLANGLRILTLEKHDLPVVSFQVWYKVGSRNERPGITGISHLLEHMMFKGTDRIGPEEFNRVIQGYGGRANAFTSADYTAYYENIAAEFLPVAMELEADRMANLRFVPDEFEAERRVVKEERRLRENSPTGRLFEELEAAAYTAHPYGWPTLGWFSDLDAISLDDLRRYYRTFYAPNNATCVIAGDITRAGAVALVERYFGPVPRGLQEPPKVVTVEPVQRGERRVIYLKRVQTPLVAAAYHTCRIGDPDQYVLDLLANILSNGESSRLAQRLVHHDKIALYAGGYNSIRTDPSLFEFYAAPIVGHGTDELETAIDSVLDSVKAWGVTGGELRKAKKQLEADFVFEQQRAYGLARQAGQAATQLDWRYVNGYLRRIRAVTNDDIKRAANKYFVPANRTVAILANDTTGRAETGQ